VVRFHVPLPRKTTNFMFVFFLAQAMRNWAHGLWIASARHQTVVRTQGARQKCLHF